MNALPKEWLRLAREDLEVAEILFNEKRWAHVCFHAQQAAEKGLKALIENKKQVPKLHDLIKLAQEADWCGYDVKSFDSYFNFLNQFYTSTRYPFLTTVLPHGVPGKKEAEQALRELKDFLQFVENNTQTR